MDDVSPLARAIRAWRLRVGFTQVRLADASKLTKQTIQNIEVGRRHPEENTQKEIAKALGITLDQLYAGPPPEQPTLRTDEELAELEAFLKSSSHLKIANDELEMLRKSHLHGRRHTQQSYALMLMTIRAAKTEAKKAKR